MKTNRQQNRFEKTGGGVRISRVARRALRGASGRSATRPTRLEHNQTVAPPENAEHSLAATKEKILDTAERLFAERGLEATSIRDITAAAAVNLGAINYHFGTKQKLIVAALNRHIEPVDQQRLALLDVAERKTGNTPPTVEALLEAMIRPAVEACFASGQRNTSFMRLMARCHSEPNPEIEKMMRARFQMMTGRFAAALARALPDLPREELFWRLNFAFGALIHTLLISSKEDSLPGNLCRKLNVDGLIQKLVAFAAAGMKSTCPEKRQVLLSGQRQSRRP